MTSDRLTFKKTLRNHNANAGDFIPGVAPASLLYMIELSGFLPAIKKDLLNQERKKKKKESTVKELRLV